VADDNPLQREEILKMNVWDFIESIEFKLSNLMAKIK